MAKHNEKKILSIKSKVYSFALKFYDEQLILGIKKMEKNMSASEKRAFEKELKKRNKQAEDDMFWDMVMIDTFLNG